MTLAVSSYGALGALQDGPGDLNLAWVTDELDFLDAPLMAILNRHMAAEAASLDATRTLLVQDPYGDRALRAAAAGFFQQASGTFQLSCAAGVGGLLQGLAALARDADCYVAGEVYPDLPHWVGRAGGRCVSLADLPQIREHAAAVAALRPALVLLERPSLFGDHLSCDEVEEICQAAPDALVVADESYANYCEPAFSAVRLLGSAANLVVLRGLTKAYWLGALRVGFALASPAATRRVRATLAPLGAPTLSLRLAAAVLALGDVTSGLRGVVRVARAEMAAALAGRGVATLASACPTTPQLYCPDLTPTELAACGLVGKMQPVWTPAQGGVVQRLRLSVPLSDVRRASFARRISGLAARGGAGPA